MCCRGLSFRERQSTGAVPRPRFQTSRCQEATSRGDGNRSAYLKTTSRWERSSHIASGLKLVRTSTLRAQAPNQAQVHPRGEKPVAPNAAKRGAGRFMGRVPLASLRERGAVSVRVQFPTDLAQAYRSAAERDCDDRPVLQRRPRLSGIDCRGPQFDLNSALRQCKPGFPVAAFEDGL